MALVALLAATGSATAGSGNDHASATAGFGNDHASAMAGTADHHPAGQTHAASDASAPSHQNDAHSHQAGAPSHQADAPTHQAGTDTRHCPSDHPMSFKIMSCCMAMVPDQVAELYRHVAITVQPSPPTVVHDRTIRPPLKPPQASV
jgi:hypothetical protein